MSTIIRPTISKKNEYWIEKHRYYELKHFCLQYPIWVKAYQSLDGLQNRPHDLALFVQSNSNSDPTAKCAEAKLYYSERIAMIETVAKQTDEYLSGYILKAITEELSYNYLKTKMDIPCSKDTYYKLYRKFFWLLNDVRN